MRVFTKQHLGMLLTFSLFQSAYGIAHGEPLSKKRRLEHSDQSNGDGEQEQEQVDTSSEGDKPQEMSDEEMQALELEALLSGLMGQGGGGSKASQEESPFKFYEYEAEENEDPYVGPQEAYEAGDLFVSMTEDWESFSEHADMNLMPLLVYGPKGFGKASLSHTLAAKAYINMYEFDFGSDWQNGSSMEKLKADITMIKKMISTACNYLDENQESKLIPNQVTFIMA
ncbi:MAG: hypothetical protein HRU09_06245 [Oligoflexales bacterium]|nr:hypothetical protein [Oligoflexales bacterium]